MCSVVGNGVDIDSDNKEIIFEIGSTTAFQNITIIDDNRLEPTESFSISIRNLIEGAGITLGINSQVTGFITDDEKGMILHTLHFTYGTQVCHKVGCN